VDINFHDLIKTGFFANIYFPDFDQKYDKVTHKYIKIQSMPNFVSTAYQSYHD